MLPCTDLPAQSVADLFRHCLRQQAERLPPGRPEGFSVLTQSTDRSVSEDRTEAAVLKGLEESRPGITKPKAYRGAGTEEVSWLACGTADFRRGSDPAAELRKAAGCPHTTDTEGE